MKHKHVTTCEHEIKVCDCCDSAYCAKCEKEWGAQKPCNLNHWPTYMPYVPQPVYPTWRPMYQFGYPISGLPYSGNICESTITVSNVSDGSYTLT